VLNFILKSTLLLKIYFWLKPRLFNLSVLIFTIIIISYVHGEYISWIEISEKKIFLGYSYIFKNILILLSILIYFLVTKNMKKNQIEINEKFESININRKETFVHLKKKGKLKTEYERILEDTDIDSKK
tara:strand:- start:3 stop:389 length:387 start_codon:yes stop_codon:yes gene_type:complete